MKNYSWVSICLNEDNETTEIKAAEVEVVASGIGWIDCENCEVLKDVKNERSVFLIGSHKDLPFGSEGVWYSDKYESEIHSLSSRFDSGITDTKAIFFRVMEEEAKKEFDPRDASGQFVLLTNIKEEVPDFFEKEFKIEEKRKIYLSEVGFSDFGEYMHNETLVESSSNPLILWKGDINADGYHDFIFQLDHGNFGFEFKLFVSSVESEWNVKLEEVASHEINTLD